MTPVVESPTPYRHVPISDLFWADRRNKGQDGGSGPVPGGMFSSRPGRAVPAGLARDRLPADCGHRSGGWPLFLTCAASSFVSCSDLGKIWTFFDRWRRHPRNLRRDRQRLWLGLAPRSPPGWGRAPLPRRLCPEISLRWRRGRAGRRALPAAGPSAAPAPLRAARADAPRPGKAPGRDRAPALASLRHSRLLRLLSPRR